VKVLSKVKTFESMLYAQESLLSEATYERKVQKKLSNVYLSLNRYFLVCVYP